MKRLLFTGTVSLIVSQAAFRIGGLPEWWSYPILILTFVLLTIVWYVLDINELIRLARAYTATLNTLMDQPNDSENQAMIETCMTELKGICLKLDDERVREFVRTLEAKLKNAA